MSDRIPVIALTGPLGAGKTTLLNHLLRRPGARVGVIVNDFGAVNLDAALVGGQVDQTASIAGGCVCCIDDAGGLDDALARLADPRRGLDVIVIEASGIAEPGPLARMIRYSGVERVRPGGVVDLVDAVEYFDHHDGGGVPPARFGVATLVAITKGDLVPEADREVRLVAIERRVREANPEVTVVRTERGRLDPALLHDVAATDDPPDELPLGALLRGEPERGDEHGHDEHGHDHSHAGSATVSIDGPVDPTLLADLLESPPPGAYRIKGVVAVHETTTRRGGYVVHVVGRQVHVHRCPPPATSTLVAIGPSLDGDAAAPVLRAALTPSTRPDPGGLRRLRRWRLLSE